MAVPPKFKAPCLSAESLQGRSITLLQGFATQTVSLVRSHPVGLSFTSSVFLKKEKNFKASPVSLPAFTGEKLKPIAGGRKDKQSLDLPVDPLQITSLSSLTL